MGLAFKKIISVSFLHDYFKDQKAQVFRVQPTSDTLKVLAGFKLTLKDAGNGFHIFSRVDDSDAFITDPNGATLVFALSLTDVSFLNYTNLTISGKTYTTGNLLLYRNSPVSNTALSPDLADMLRPPLFTYQLPVKAANGADDATLVIKDANGVVQTFDPPLPSSIAPGVDLSYNIRLSLEKKPAGLYTFTSQNSTGTKVQSIYIDSELVRENVFALLRIDITSGLNFSGGAKEYTVSFVKNSAHWSYYVVNKSNISLSDFDLLVDDTTGSTNPGGTKYNFASSIAGADDKVDDLETVIFSSGELIPYSEVPKVGLNLVKKEKSGAHPPVVLIDNLPNAPGSKVIENGTVKIYVFV